MKPLNGRQEHKIKSNQSAFSSSSYEYNTVLQSYEYNIAFLNKYMQDNHYIKYTRILNTNANLYTHIYFTTIAARLKPV